MISGGGPPRAGRGTRPPRSRCSPGPSRGGEGIVVSQVHPLGLLVELHDAQVGDHHLGTAVAGQAGALTAAGAVHPAAGGDVVDLLHEAALLVLHHDDGVAVGGDAVGAAGAGEPGLGLDIVALAVDAGGVHVAVGIDLGAADEGDQPVRVVQPLVGLKADEADVGPLHGAVSHEAVVAHRAGGPPRGSSPSGRSPRWGGRRGRPPAWPGRRRSEEGRCPR